jgi:hypothetical protein
MDERTELQQVRQKGEDRQVQVQHLPPPHFSWPSSRPGPLATPPPPGQRPIPLRTDQMVEIGYNQEKGIPATDDARAGAPSFDQFEAAQEVSRKRRKRK